MGGRVAWLQRVRQWRCSELNSSKRAFVWIRHLNLTPPIFPPNASNTGAQRLFHFHFVGLLSFKAATCYLERGVVFVVVDVGAFSGIEISFVRGSCLGDGLGKLMVRWF